MSESGTQERKIYILDEDECPPCDEVKEALKEEIASGKVEVLKITSDDLPQQGYHPIQVWGRNNRYP